MYFERQVLQIGFSLGLSRAMFQMQMREHGENGKIVTIRRRIGFLLLFCLLVPGDLTRAPAEALEQNLYQDEIWEPCVETDESLSTGQVTVWSCIMFGSYPQTEIVAAPSAAVDDDAIQEEDFPEDPDLY